MQYKMVFAYLRVSREDREGEESNSIGNQKLLIEQYLDRHEELKGAEVQFFSDDGYSGTNFDRPGFRNMMEKIKLDSSCCVIVKELSRLGRDTIEIQNYMEKVFPFLGVRVIAINDVYDSIRLDDNRMETEAKFRNLINGMYPEICLHNFKQNLRRLAKQGEYLGPVPPYGYSFSGENKRKLIVDEKAAQVVRYIFQERIKGKTYTDIARSLNEEKEDTPSVYLRKKGFSLITYENKLLWNRMIIKRILLNQVYVGTMIGHKTEITVIGKKEARKVPEEERIYVPGTHPGIVSFDEQQIVINMYKEGISGKLKKEKICTIEDRKKDNICLHVNYSVAIVKKLCVSEMVKSCVEMQN